MKRVKCKSGIEGWQCRLRKSYSSLKEFSIYANFYGLHKRLGYKTPEAAWRANPLVRGSVNPSDFQRVLKRYPKKVVIAHARKMNTKASARKLAQVDSGPYTISR